MGDRCYMTVTCRREDAHLFTNDDLGFQFFDEIEEKETSRVVQLEDQEANYAHSGDMPTGIPYHGSNGAGDDYGEGVFACDGGLFIDECEAVEGSPVVIMLDDGTLEPNSEARARAYLNAMAKVGAILKDESIYHVLAGKETAT